MSYKQEHPDWIAPSDFRLDELEKLGFEDISWRNDAYPFWGHYTHGFTLGVDYEEEMSDWGHLSDKFHRYHLYKRELGEGEKEHECLHDEADLLISPTTRSPFRVSLVLGFRALPLSASLKSSASAAGNISLACFMRSRVSPLLL